jgi:CheY-like chemotaxis protein
MTHRVLVADDSTTIQKVIKIAFARHPLEIVEASSFAEALSACARRLPQLLILDATLPGAHGPEEFKKLREDAGGVPVILFIGSYDAVDEGAFRAAGIHNILKKPFDSASLVKMVEDLLQMTSGKREKQGTETAFPPSPFAAPIPSYPPPPKHPTMYLSPEIPPPPGGRGGFATHENSQPGRSIDSMAFPPPPPTGVGAHVPTATPVASASTPHGYGAIPGYVPPPHPVSAAAHKGISATSVFSPPPSPNMVPTAYSSPPAFGAGGFSPPSPPPFPEATAGAKSANQDFPAAPLAGLPELPFELSIPKELDDDDQGEGFVPNFSLSPSEQTTALVPPNVGEIPPSVTLDGARRGQKAFEAPEPSRSSTKAAGAPIAPQDLAPSLASVTSGLMEELTRDLPELVRRVVEDYCDRHFKSLAREFIASELRRLADEKARHLVDN